MFSGSLSDVLLFDGSLFSRSPFSGPLCFIPLFELQSAALIFKRLAGTLLPPSDLSLIAAGVMN